MALDEPKENDVTVTAEGIQYVIDKDLFETVKPVMVDFVEGPGGSGFRLTSSLYNGPGSGGNCCG